jgi:hypothetical protein
MGNGLGILDDSPELEEGEVLEEGEIDPSALAAAAATDWSQASFAMMALLQDFENKHELNNAEKGAAAQEAAVAAVNAAANAGQGTHSSSAARKDNPPFKLRLYFNTSDSHSLGLKKSLLTRGHRWLLVKLSNLKTLHREYSALQSCDLLHLKNALLLPPTNAAEAIAQAEGRAPGAASTSSASATSASSSTNPACVLAGIARQATVPLMLAQFPPHLSSSLNTAQRTAIARALLRKEGFSLVQGPPGTGQLQDTSFQTNPHSCHHSICSFPFLCLLSYVFFSKRTGKTKTIVGMINMLYLQFQAKMFLAGHESSYKPPGSIGGGGAAPLMSRQVSAHSRNALQRSSSTSGTGSSSSSSKQFRLLVCAPSNAAINEIVDRLEGALLDFDGKPVQLNIVRLGAGANKDKMTRNTPRPAAGAAGASGAAAMLPFHERVSLDQLVRDHKASQEAGGGGSGNGGLDGGLADDSAGIAAELASTPLEVLKSRAVAAIRTHQERVSESNRIHARIKEIEILVRQAELEREHELMMVEAGQVPKPAPGGSTVGVASNAGASSGGGSTGDGNALTRLAAYEAELEQLNVKKRAALQAKAEQNRVVALIKASAAAEQRTSLSPMDNLRCALLRRAHIVCTTLSGAGIEMFRNLKLSFSSVIVDESAQSSEIQTLIPLKYNVKRCILGQLFSFIALRLAQGWLSLLLTNALLLCFYVCMCAQSVIRTS